MVPKLDFGSTSSGISPESINTFIEEEQTNVNPGLLKAVLEVKVGDGIVTDKNPPKSDKKDEDVKNIKILLCNLQGECKIHEIRTGGSGTDDYDDKTKYKPIIVTDFNEDPLKGSENDHDDDDGDKRSGKKNPKVPVIVGYRGAVKDDGFTYTGYRYGQAGSRLPAYYGMDLSPVFHQPYPGPHSPPRPGFSYGSYHPTYPFDHTLRCVYPHNEQRYPISYFPDYRGVRPYGHTSFPGHGPRTPSPYGNFRPTRKPDSFHAIITPLGRRNGAGRSDRPADYWPVNKPTDPEIVAVHGKTNFDEDDLTVGVTGPLYPGSGNGNVKIDGKLGEPLSTSDTK